MRTLINTLWILILSITVLSAQEDRLTPEILWSLGRASLDDVSPDGKAVLFGVTYYDVDKDKGNRDLYIVPTQGGVSKKITAFEGSEYNAVYRPDGQKIGFLRAGNLWEMNPDGSDQRQVSEIPMNGFSYSPDGKKLLYIQSVKYGQTTQDVHPDLNQSKGRIIDDLMYRHWDSWDDYTVNNIFYTGYEDGKLTGDATNINREPFGSPLNPFGGMEQIAWQPDGQGIAYTCKKSKGLEYATGTNADIYLYNLNSGQTENLSNSLPGYDMDPVFSPDGKYLMWSSMEMPGFEADRNRIMLYNMRTKAREELTRGLDQNADHPVWSADGKFLYYLSSDQATVQLFSMEIVTRKTKQLTSGIHNYASFKVADPNTLVAARMSMSEPVELFRVDIQSGQQTAITKINEPIWGKIKKGEVTSRTVKTTDGQDMHVWVIYPPDFDPAKKYPTLLYCQGGPQSTVSQFFSYRWNFQIMAANDYIIVAPNRRGLPGFGQAWNDQISGDWGGLAQQDHLSAIDALKQEPYVDENRLGAIGASYGGYSVYWLAGNHEKRFKTFISHCGLFNLESWYGTTEELFFANHDIGGPYWIDNPPVSYSKDSPHLYAGNWDTPILVIHGEKDFRVPISEGMQAFQVAQIKGIKSRFLYFPDEGHWVLKPQNGILWQREFFRWLKETL